MKTFHINTIGFTNYGDTMLSTATQNVFGNYQNAFQMLQSLNIRSEICPKTIDLINEHDLLLMGGGGLFLRKEETQDISGWQWNCKLDTLDKIKPPIAIFGVGYNRFRDEESFNSLFKEHAKKTFDKSCFIGLRNKYSIEEMKAYVDSETQKKMFFQPCPTTILKYIHSGIYTKHTGLEKIINLNLAIDMAANRFGSNENLIMFLARIVKALKILTTQGWKVNIISHVPGDEKMTEIMMQMLPVEHDFYHYDVLNEDSFITITQLYASSAINIGMRGHSQMVPFGFGNPIISLISHNKVGAFLSDIERKEWGLEVLDEELDTKLIEKVTYIADNIHSIREDIANIQEDILNTTNTNIEYIKNQVS